MKTIVLTNQLLRDYLVQKRGAERPAEGKLHLIGIRGAVPVSAAPTGCVAVQLIRNTPNDYNDAIGVFGTELRLFTGSVDPGSTWTLRPSNPNGCAHLLNGHWRYQLGPHRGKPALVQAGPVKVWRDRDRDHARDPHEMVDTGWFGINIHAGGVSPDVDAYSAGCQVIHGGWAGKPWKTFYGLCKASGQRTFDYYLVDGAGLAEFAAGYGR